MTLTESTVARTLEYSKKPSSRRFPVYYLVYTTLTLLPTILALISLLFVTPMFKEVFRNWGIALPATTTALFNIADFTRHGVWIVSLVFAFLFPLLLARHTARQAPRIRRVSYVLIYTILILLLVLAIVTSSGIALWHPFIQMAKGLVAA